MKFQKMFRIQMLLMGMGAGLLLAKPVCAQQDMDPTIFEDSANTTVMDQALKATPSAEASEVAPADSVAALAAQEVGAAGLTSMDTSAAAVLMIGIGSIVLLGLAEAVRGSRRRTWREKASGSFPAGVTAN
jgi:hypothetical protein